MPERKYAITSAKSGSSIQNHFTLLPLFKMFLLFATLSVFLSSAVLSLQSQQVYASDRVRQGAVLQVFVFPVRGKESAEFTLLNAAGKTVAQSQGFLFDYVHGTSAKKRSGRMRNWVLVGLFGIPSTQQAGDYILRASVVHNQKSSKVLERPVQIQEFDFPSEAIQLNQQMDRILNPRDPAVRVAMKQQADKLWALLQRQNQEDLYHSGNLQRPVAAGRGRTSSAYGYIRKFIYPSGKVQHSVHKGHDIAAKSGEQVLASGTGLIVMAEDRIVTGKTVILSLLPGVYVKYQHMSKLDVKEGQRVRRGEVLGSVGKSGFATGNHLHTELWISGQNADISLYFDKPLIDTNQISSMIGRRN